ncbi:MAG TPA: hypothetical protein VMY18_04840 [Acidobacteriota bacterium]|nr:hypothetical protein [Acidobacteriota bacterium]
MTVAFHTEPGPFRARGSNRLEIRVDGDASFREQKRQLRGCRTPNKPAEPFWSAKALAFALLLGGFKWPCCYAFLKAKTHETVSFSLGNTPFQGPDELFSATEAPQSY